MEKRIEYTSNMPEIFYLPGNALEKKQPDLASKFYVYLQEIDLPWEKFRSLGRFDEHTTLDAFVRGPIRWQDKNFARAFENHIHDIPHSQWLQKRALLALADPAAAQNTAAHEILKKIRQQIKNIEAPRATKLILDRFLQDADQIMNKAPASTAICKNGFSNMLGNIKDSPAAAVNSDPH